MQETFRQHVQQLMKDHKRRSLWKRATAVLSAVVLLSTFLSLRNFAIAVTEEKAAEAQITEAVQAALAETASAKENNGVTVTNEFTPEEVGATDEAVNATPEAANTELPLEGKLSAKLTDEVSGSDTAPVTEGTVPQSPESGDRGDSPAVTSTATTTDEVSSAEAPAAVDIPDAPVPTTDAPEATNGLPLEGEMSAELTEGVSLLRMAPLAAATDTRAASSQITSATPVALRVCDPFGNPAVNVYTSDLLTVEISWGVDDLSEIQKGDYFDIALPAEVEFVQGSGAIALSDSYTMPDGSTLWEGTNVVEYEVSGHNLHIVYKEAAVMLHELGLLHGGLNQGGREWSTVRLHNARISEASAFTPSVSLNNKTVSNTYGPINATAAGSGQITDVSIKSVTYHNELGREATTFGSEEDITLRIAWEALSSGSRVITDGDWFEIELPEQLVYDGSDRRTTDDNGNVIRTRVMQRESDSKWVLRVDFENVVRGYSKFSSTTGVTGMAGDVVFNGRQARFNAVTKVAGGTSTNNTTLTITKTSTTTPDGLWRVRYVKKYRKSDGSFVDSPPYSTGNHRLTLREDFLANYNRVCITYDNEHHHAYLYVIANHGGTLKQNPFWDYPQKLISTGNPKKWQYNPNQAVDFVPGDSNFTSESRNGESNYLDAYCAQLTNSNKPDGSYNFTNVENQYNAATAAQIKRIIATAYPYVSLDRMASNLGVDRAWLDTDIAVTAVQAAIWETVNGGYASNYQVGFDRTLEPGRMRELVDKIKNFQYGSAVSYRFVTGPTVTFSTVGNRLDATVSGKIGPGGSINGFTGTFTNGASTRTFNVNTDGTFTATLTNVSRADQFRLRIDGSTTSAVDAYFFDPGNYSTEDPQCLIAGRVYTKPIHLDWEYQEDDKREVRVVKQWKDRNGNVITGWPQGATVEVTLYRQVKGGAVEKVVPVNALQTNPATLTASGSAYSWTDLPLTDGYGRVYTYTVVETKVPDGYEYVDMITEGNSGKLTFTAINEEQEEEKTKVKVIKEWRGVPDNKKDDFKAVVQLFARIDKGPNVNNGNGWKTPVLIKDRKDSTVGTGLNVTGDYQIDLTTTTPSYAGGYTDTTAELTKSNNWNVTFNDLPKYDADGNLIQYLIREIAVYDGAGNDITDEFSLTYNPAPQYTFGDGNYYAFAPMDEELPTVTVTNTKHGALTVEKKWVNADGLTEWSEVLPGGIKVELSAIRNGKEVPAALLEQLLGAPTTVELNAENNWSYTWDYVYTTNIVYYVKEVEFVNGNADRYVRIDESGTPIPYDEPVQVAYDKDQKIFKICLVNKRKPVEVELIKEDKLNPDKKLEGATFRLYDWKGGQVLNPAEKDGLFRTDASGKVKIGDSNGLHLMISQKTLGEDYIYRYVLVEVDPPAGYIKRQNPLTVTFHVEISNGNPVLVIDKVDDASAAAGLVTADGEQLKLNIKNEQASYTLPETGGSGTAMPVAIGAILMLMSAGLYILRRKRDTEVI